MSQGGHGLALEAARAAPDIRNSKRDTVETLLAQKNCRLTIRGRTLSGRGRTH